jgi:hypothetical protein
MDNRKKQFDFWYAVNNTEIVVPSKRHLETFGNTIINYFLVSELMDDPQKVRVREGRMQAFRPQIIMPSAYSPLEMDGFGEEAKRYLEWLRENEDSVRVLRYGYTLKQESFNEQIVSDNLTAVLERVKADAAGKDDPFAAVIKGVDDPWDVCLVRLFWQTIQCSAPFNLRELHERHMFEMQDGIPVGVREEIEKGFMAAGKDVRLIRSLGQLLQEHGVFEQYQDRFFNLVKRG